MPEAKFDLGRLLVTPGVLSVLESTSESPIDFMARHASGDWGDICNEDKTLNDEALKNGGRLLSSFKAKDGTTIWAITEAADESGRREATTLLLKTEY